MAAILALVLVGFAVRRTRLLLLVAVVPAVAAALWVEREAAVTALLVTYVVAFALLMAGKALRDVLEWLVRRSRSTDAGAA